LDALIARAERRLNPVAGGDPGPVSDRALALHATLRVADLHADSLLWGRDLLKRGERGHTDVPRMIEGRVMLQCLSASVKVPARMNLERNTDGTDAVRALAIGGRWPPRTWGSLLERALFLADRAHRLADRSAGTFRLIETSLDLEIHFERVARSGPSAAGLLTIEGAHALEDDPANVEVVADAGFRMISPAHFFDTAFGGSAHGVEQPGLTPKGREMLRRMEARRVLLDVAHASARTVDDAIALATRPIVASHTGARGVCDNARNLSDAHLVGIAATGGLIGVGFWPTACGGADAAAIARSIDYVVNLVGVEHVALGSDWDGAVPVPFDAANVVRLTDALLEIGFEESAIRAVMGENVLRLLAEQLPSV
jgi:microsomal dipeptidase-like Zn-dependent dipeptidase